jgi:acetyl esterase/lipase
MLIVAIARPGAAQPPQSAEPSRPPTAAAITYASIDGEPLQLDLYLPENTSTPPLLVFIHGGAWQFGNRDNPGALTLLDKGFAIASVSFRSAQVAPLPAQIHDLKAAIRFLRANADRYGYDADHIATTGVSSGGHLAALAGLTNGSQPHEGTLGEYRDTSSEVQAVVSWFGASNLTSILAQSTPRGVSVREPALAALLGGPAEEKTELARFGSPVFYVDADDPPLLLLHGDQDPQMPINQAHELHGAAKDAGIDVHFEVVHGAGHGGTAFFDEERTELVAEFLEAAFKP